MYSYRFILAVFLFAVVLSGQAQVFDDYFVNKTLRLDYVFAGNSSRQDIFLSGLSVSPVWYGKRARLSEVPVEGNGQVVMTDSKSGKVIYRNSFSTLFQEWLTYDEAKESSRSFENVFLVPFPKDSATITVRLMDNRRQVRTEYTHKVNPSDILIRHIGETNRTPFLTIQQADDTTRCIHIAYVAEGYRQGEMDDFVNDVRVASNALFSHSPYCTTSGLSSPSILATISRFSSVAWILCPAI